MVPGTAVVSARGGTLHKQRSAELCRLEVRDAQVVTVAVTHRGVRAVTWLEGSRVHSSHEVV